MEIQVGFLIYTISCFLELPERARTGKLVIEESSKNLLIIGLKHNEFDSYDPGEYDHNDPDFIDVHPNEIGKIRYSIV